MLLFDRVDTSLAVVFLPSVCWNIRSHNETKLFAAIMIAQRVCLFRWFFCCFCCCFARWCVYASLRAKFQTCVCNFHIHNACINLFCIRSFSIYLGRCGKNKNEKSLPRNELKLDFIWKKVAEKRCKNMHSASASIPCTQNTYTNFLTFSISNSCEKLCAAGWYTVRKFFLTCFLSGSWYIFEMFFLFCKQKTFYLFQTRSPCTEHYRINKWKCE